MASKLKINNSGLLFKRQIDSSIENKIKNFEWQNQPISHSEMEINSKSTNVMYWDSNMYEDQIDASDIKMIRSPNCHSISNLNRVFSGRSIENANNKSGAASIGGSIERVSVSYKIYKLNL